MNRKRWRWQRARLIIAGFIILLLLIVGLQTILLARSLQIAYRDGLNFAEIAKGGNLNTTQFAMAQTFLQDADQALDDANQKLGFFKPLLGLLGRLPFYGPTFAAIPPLLKTGHELANLTVQGFAVAKPVLLAPAGAAAQVPPLTRLAEFMRTSQPQLTVLAHQAATQQQALAMISPDNLLTGLAEPVADLQAGVGLLTSGLRLSDALPELLGAEKAQTYLILVQNNHELRGTGGFVTSIGALTLQQGKVIDFNFADSYAVGQTTGPQFSAPDPMQRYMNIDQLLLRDVNWSPDLPTTAQIARSLYAQETGRLVDGVMTIDLHAVELMVGALEPLAVPGSPLPITGANVVEQIKQMWAAPLPSANLDDATQTETTAQADSAKVTDWWKNRKDFVPQIATVAFARLQAGHFDYTNMAQALYSALDERSIQVWSAKPEIAVKLAALQWDGGLHPPPQKDFLALVDTNMGYNKVDAVMQRRLAYQVDWPDGADRPAQATVTVIYQHPLQIADYDCDPRPHYGQMYDDMIKRCYFDYVRLFAPAGSQLLSIEGVEPDSVSSQGGEGGAKFFAGHFIVKPGEQKTIIFRYQLPDFIKPAGYGLVVQKQSGAQPLPLSIQVGKAKYETILQTGQLVWQLSDGH
ncbi:hypothetical protein BH10CHL1_BH10CHL1_06920 [soil metagenome]